MTPRRECGDIFSVCTVGLGDMLAIVRYRCWVRRRPCVDVVAGNRCLRESPKPISLLPPELMLKRGTAAVDLAPIDVAVEPWWEDDESLATCYQINLRQDDMAGCNLVAVVGASVVVAAAPNCNKTKLAS
jgi:hypothetical protein